MAKRWIALGLTALCLLSCREDDGTGTAPIIRLIRIGHPFAPPGTSPPFGMTWFVRFAENVPLARMQAFFTKIVTLNTDVWNATEGQVYIGKVVFSDKVHPGVLASSPAPASTDGIDFLIYSDANWDVLPALGFVEIPSGREDRIIGVPESTDQDVLLHESGHLMFQLSWEPGPLLVDEYEDGIQDSACIMELASARRLCAGDNHVSQTSQPTSCWQQILADYPAFSLTGTHMAATPAPVTSVTYADNP